MYLRRIQYLLAPIVDAAFRINFPELRKFMAKVNGENDNNAAIAWKGFALNASGSSWHIDSNDYIDGICALVPFGDYTGGELAITDLKMTFDIRPGDIFFFSSRHLIHGNLEFIGERYSIVFFLHQLAVSDFFIRTNNQGIKTTEEALGYCKNHYAYKESNIVRKAKKNRNEHVDLYRFK